MRKKPREQAIEELTLMLMYLNRFSDNNEYARFREISWKGYDYDTLAQLNERDLVYSPKGKASYFTEAGREKARELLVKYGLSDYAFYEKYEFRFIRPEEAEAAAEIEAICFPPSETCTLDIMKERVSLAGDCFLVAIDRETGRMIGFVNGLCTNEWSLRDELFTDTSLHDPDGCNIMICSVAVLPEYRKQGIAREMMWEFLRKQQAQGRKQAVLTCVPSKVKMYKKFGFVDRGESESTWGGEKWHEMFCTLNL